MRRSTTGPIEDIETAASAVNLPGRGEDTFIWSNQQGDSGNVYVGAPYTINPPEANKVKDGRGYDYCTIRIVNRDTANVHKDLVYRFLINPDAVSVSRQSVDARSMTRSGWQLGVWGEDYITINLQGRSAGQYRDDIVVVDMLDPVPEDIYSQARSLFTKEGLADRFSDYFTQPDSRIMRPNTRTVAAISDRAGELTQSVRNIAMLRKVYQNNGYWFTGEDQFGTAGWSGTRRRITRHADVILTVGNFVWYGMFTDMEISQDANTPFNMDFNLGFLAWKERFLKSAGYHDQIHSGYRGHSHEGAVELIEEYKRRDALRESEAAVVSNLNNAIMKNVSNSMQDPFNTPYSIGGGTLTGVANLSNPFNGIADPSQSGGLGVIPGFGDYKKTWLGVNK